MEHLSEVDVETSSSLAMILNGHKRGHAIYQYSPQKMTLTTQRLFANGRKIIGLDMKKKPFYKVGKDELIDLSTFDIVFMRQDPPFNMEYITATYMLEAIKRKVWVINDPVAVRNAPEKIFPLLFHDYIPDTIITEDYKSVKAFLKAEKEIVIKPLYMFGGEDVRYFKDDSKSEKELKKTFDKMVKRYAAPVIVQKFIPEVKVGDKRVLLIDGEFRGVFLRIPVKGSILANGAHGADIKKTTLTKREKEICNAIKPILKANGLVICGLDLIGEQLTEVNLTSPAAFCGLEYLYGDDGTDYLWDFVEKKLGRK